MSTIPQVDPYYRVEVDAGPYSWTLEKGDAPGYGLADPLRVGWSVPNKPLFHAQPDPMTASFSVIAASMADVAQLQRGDAVAIRVYGWPPGTANPHATSSDLDPVNYPPIVIFRGRVANPSAAPHALGVLVTYSCVDYTVDLAERTIGADAWPAEGNDERLDRMFDEAGVMRPPYWYEPASLHFFSSFSLVARSASPTDARSAVWQLVDWVTETPDEPFGRYQYMTTRYAAGLLDGDVPDPLGPFDVPIVPARLAPGDDAAPPRLPGRLVAVGAGRYGVDIVEDAARRAAVIDARHVDFSARWTQSKSTDPDTVTVTGSFIDTDPAAPAGTVGSVTVAAVGAVPIGASLPCDANDVVTARAYAAANVADPGGGYWVADAFTWYADQDPWPMIADGLWFIEGAHVIASRYPVVVNGIDPTRNPTGRDWYAGRLRGATFILAGGRYSVSFQLLRSLLRPAVFDPSRPGYDTQAIAYNDAPVVGLTYADLDTSSHFDYRLVRSS